MPIFQHKRGRVLFIHIPKTAGSSIEQWLVDHGHPLEKLATWSGWNNQHAAKDLYQTWGEFDYKFAVVRHPLERFVSALGFRTIHGGDANKVATDAIKKYEKGILSPHWGNHLQPQVDFVDEETEVFKYEENFFQRIATALELPGPFPHKNKTRTTVSSSDLSKEIIQHIQKLYAEDYKTFGYETQTET